MERQPNTNTNGNSWTLQQKQAVWEKGRRIPNLPNDQWRWDICGFVMQWSEFGNRQSDIGWEIDHIIPVANGGNDEPGNLQPLNWKNNLLKGDKINWECC
jgi:HNH endonuclease.